MTAKARKNLLSFPVANPFPGEPAKVLAFPTDALREQLLGMIVSRLLNFHEGITQLLVSHDETQEQSETLMVLSRVLKQDYDPKTTFVASAFVAMILLRLERYAGAREILDLLEGCDGAKTPAGRREFLEIDRLAREITRVGQGATPEPRRPSRAPKRHPCSGIIGIPTR